MADLFTDLDFPASMTSVAGSSNTAYSSEPAQWRRFTELWPNELVPPPAGTPVGTVVQQGSTLGDCWLLSSLAALAARQPAIVRGMFAPTTAEDWAAGRVRVRLCPNGWWREVVLDTLLPCDASGRPLFCGTSGAGWAALVEKAFAKLHGSYAALEGGRSIEALVDLTGGVCEQLRLTDEGAEAQSLLGTSLKKAYEQRALMCCTRRGRTKGEPDDAPHIPANHAYAIVEVSNQPAGLSVRIRDPAAVKPGGGDGAAAGGADEDVGEVDAGDAWCRLEVFLKLFDKVLLCRTLPEAPPRPPLSPTAHEDAVLSGLEASCWLQHRLRVPTLTGGVPTAPTWCTNPQWQLSCKGKALIFASLGQAGRKPRVLALSVLHAGRNSSTRSGGGTGARVWALDAEQLAAQAGPQLSRDVSLRWLAPEAATFVLAPWWYAEVTKPSSAEMSTGRGAEMSTSRAEGTGDASAAASGAAATAAAASASAVASAMEVAVGGGFFLRVWSDAPITLTPIAPLHRTSLVGCWRGEGPSAAAHSAAARRSDGGSWPAVSWALNPQYGLGAAVDGRAIVVLERLVERPSATPTSATVEVPNTAASVAAAADGVPLETPCWAPSIAPPEVQSEAPCWAPAATTGEAPEEAKDDVVMLDDLAAPFERARAIGVQVLRAAAAPSGGAGGASGAGAVVVLSGLSGNVRGTAGQLLPVLSHPSLSKTDEELELFGIGGQRRPQSLRKVADGSSSAPPAAHAPPEAIAAAHAAARSLRGMVTASADTLEASVGYVSESLASGLIALRAAMPRILVPSTLEPGQPGRFRLTILSDTPIACVPLAHEAYSLTIKGSWHGKPALPGGPRPSALAAQSGMGPAPARHKSDSSSSLGSGSSRASRASRNHVGGGAPNAGGCHLEETWGINPQYAITVGAAASAGDARGAAASLHVVLRRPDAEWTLPMLEKPVDSMVGFYLLRGPSNCAGASLGPGAARRVPLRSKSHARLVHETCFAPTLEASCALELHEPRPVTLVLVPSTFGAGQTGPFSIELASDEVLSCEQLS